ncbi:MAG: hypothetical protein HY289_10140 [Planctomycetes bacterium]|nr:hypothetical protein [Planctomycetota bacterium]
MRAFITCAVLTVTVLTVNSASAQTVDAGGLIDSWYHRYLGRHVDSAGLHDHLHAIRHGAPLDVVEASILASPEYYVRNGNTPEGFVAALYRDVLGRRAGAHEFSHQVNHVLREGRTAAALRIISERNPPVIVARPATVIVTRPVYVEPVVVVPAKGRRGEGEINRSPLLPFSPSPLLPFSLSPITPLACERPHRPERS